MITRENKLPDHYVSAGKVGRAVRLSKNDVDNDLPRSPLKLQLKYLAKNAITLG